MSQRWRTPGVSPFFTERARTRAPEILAYTAALERIARIASGADPRRSFKVGIACVHVTPVTAGWTLCAVSTGINPRLIVERLERAGNVMALALVDGASREPSGSGSAPSGAAAEVARPVRERAS